MADVKSAMVEPEVTTELAALKVRIQKYPVDDIGCREDDDTPAEKDVRLTMSRDFLAGFLVCAIWMWGNDNPAEGEFQIEVGGKELDGEALCALDGESLREYTIDFEEDAAYLSEDDVWLGNYVHKPEHEFYSVFRTAIRNACTIAARKSGYDLFSYNPNTRGDWARHRLDNAETRRGVQWALSTFWSTTAFKPRFFLFHDGKYVENPRAEFAKWATPTESKEIPGTARGGTASINPRAQNGIDPDEWKKWLSGPVGDAIRLQSLLTKIAGYNPTVDKPFIVDPDVVDGCDSGADLNYLYEHVFRNYGESGPGVLHATGLSAQCYFRGSSPVWHVTKSDKPSISVFELSRMYKWNANPKYPC